MINLYSRDLRKAARFYSQFGFIETFRTPATGEPVHIELRLENFTLGIATLQAAREEHGLEIGGDGRWIEIVIWTDDADSAVSLLAGQGAQILRHPHDFLDGALRAAWVVDPDGNPVQLVQRKSLSF